MANCYIWNALSQNIENSESCFSLRLLKEARNMPKNCHEWSQNKVWPFIRKTLMWTFWDHKRSWSKKSISRHLGTLYVRPLSCIFKKIRLGEHFVHIVRGFWLVPSHYQTHRRTGEILRVYKEILGRRRGEGGGSHKMNNRQPWQLKK